MTENKFKVGDRVVMAHPEKSNTTGITVGRKGRVMHVDDVPGYIDVFVNWDEPVPSLVNNTLHGCKLGHGWWVNHESLELENATKENKPTHVIVMKYDGNTTTAIEKVDGKIVAKSEAHRNPADDASSSIGFKLAFERLMEEVAKEDDEKKKSPNKAKYKITDIHVGDLIRLRDDLEVGEKYGLKGAGITLHEGMNTTTFMKVTETNSVDVYAENGYWYAVEMIGEVFHPASC